MSTDEQSAAEEALHAPAGIDEPEEPRSVFPFRRVLPIGQLVLCVLLLWPARAKITREYESALGITPAPLVYSIGDFYLPWHPGMPLAETERNSTEIASALNLPGGLVQLPYPIFSPEHQEWRPHEMNFEVWRATTWPLLCIPFWWIAGRGLEAILAARAMRQGTAVCVTPKVGWIETIVATLIMLICGTLAVGLTVDGDLQLAIFGVGAGMWTVLASMTVVAKFVQWRMTRKPKASRNKPEQMTNAAAQ